MDSFHGYFVTQKPQSQMDVGGNILREIPTQKRSRKRNGFEFLYFWKISSRRSIVYVRILEKSPTCLIEMIGHMKPCAKTESQWRLTLKHGFNHVSTPSLFENFCPRFFLQTRGAQKGHEVGEYCFRYGMYHELPPADIQQAFRWYRRGARMNHPKCSTMLGKLHMAVGHRDDAIHFLQKTGRPNAGHVVQMEDEWRSAGGWCWKDLLQLVFGGFIWIQIF